MEEKKKKGSAAGKVILILLLVVIAVLVVLRILKPGKGVVTEPLSHVCVTAPPYWLQPLTHLKLCVPSLLSLTAPV